MSTVVDDNDQTTGIPAECRLIALELAGFAREDGAGVPVAQKLEGVCNALIAQGVPELDEQAELLSMRGSARMHMGRFAEAERDLRGALELSPGMGNCFLLLSAYEDLAWITRQIDSKADGVPLWEEAASRFRAVYPDDSYCTAQILTNLGLAYGMEKYESSGGLSKAIRYIDEALALETRPVLVHGAAGMIHEEAARRWNSHAETEKATYHYKKCLAGRAADEREEKAQEIARGGLAGLGSQHGPETQTDRKQATSTQWKLLLGALACSIGAVLLLTTGSTAGWVFAFILVGVAALCMYRRSNIKKALKADE